MTNTSRQLPIVVHSHIIQWTTIKTSQLIWYLSTLSLLCSWSSHYTMQPGLPTRTSQSATATASNPSSSQLADTQQAHLEQDKRQVFQAIAYLKLILYVWTNHFKNFVCDFLKYWCYVQEFGVLSSYLSCKRFGAIMTQDKI